MKKEDIRDVLKEFSKEKPVIFGKRKYYYVFTFAILVLIMTCGTILKYGPDSKDILTPSFVLICVLVVCAYPAMNVLNKLVHSLSDPRIQAIVSELLKKGGITFNLDQKD